MSRRVLVVRQDKLGDLLLSTPILRALHEQGDHVTLFYQPSLEGVVENLSSIDDEGFVPFRPPLWKVPSLARRIKRGNYDAVLMLRNDSSSFALAAWLARVPMRVGVAKKLAHRTLTHNRPDLYDLGHEHVVRRMMNIAAPLLQDPTRVHPLEFPVSESAQRTGTNSIPQGSVVVHPGTGGTARPYPAHLWAKVVDALCEQHSVLVSAGPSEEALAQQVAGDRAGIVTGLTLEELAGGLSGARLLICGSTGVMHIAASQQTPVLLVEPTPDAKLNVDRWHPWASPFRAVAAERMCPGCKDRDCHRSGTECLDSLPPERIIRAAQDFLATMPE